MKRFIISFLLVITLICFAYSVASYQREKALLQATETLIDRVYTDNENYFLDVLSESDEYQDYLEIL
jgi:CHASE3 domain sensor protein